MHDNNSWTNMLQDKVIDLQKNLETAKETIERQEKLFVSMRNALEIKDNLMDSFEKRIESLELALNLKINEIHRLKFGSNEE